MSRKSNTWSKRRHRHPRPPVCRSNDPYEDWPAIVTINHTWNMFVPPGSSSFSGMTKARRVKNTVSYVGVGTASNGQPFTVAVNVPKVAAVPLQSSALYTLIATVSTGAIAFGFGENSAWDGTVPFTPSAQPIRQPASFGSGQWSYSFLGQ